MGRLVVVALSRAEQRRYADTLAFVVMPDHVHWLISLGDTTLPALMRDVTGYSGFHLKQCLRRRDGVAPKAVWQEGYYDHALRAEEDLQDTAHYIVMNPVRAGLVSSVRDYPLWDAKWL